MTAMRGSANVGVGPTTSEAKLLARLFWPALSTSIKHAAPQLLRRPAQALAEQKRHGHL
jgi:hypothetical protein